MIHKILDMEKLPACVGIIGSRSFADDPKSDMKMYEEVRRFVYKLQKDTEVVSGGAKGIDSYAEDAAYLKKMRRTIYRRKKGLKGRAEVVKDIHERNTRIVQHVYKQEGVLVAFMDEDNHNGSASTIKKAQKLGVPVVELLYDSKGNFLFMLAPEEYLKETPTEVV